MADSTSDAASLAAFQEQLGLLVQHTVKRLKREPSKNTPIESPEESQKRAELLKSLTREDSRPLVMAMDETEGGTPFNMEAPSLRLPGEIISSKALGDAEMGRMPDELQGKKQMEPMQQHREALDREDPLRTGRPAKETGEPMSKI